MTTKNNAIDVVVVLYREYGHYHSFLDCLRQQALPYQLHVALHDALDHVDLPDQDNITYYHGPNSGYAGGVQRVLSCLQSDWFLLANTDIEFDSGVIESMLAHAMSADSHIAAIGPKILYPDGRLQSCGGLLLGPEGLCRPRGRGETDEGQYDHLVDVPLISGCFMLCHRQIFQQLGGFRGDMFMYVEDVEFCLKALRSGYLFKSISSVSIVHHHSGASDRYSSMKLYHLERNHWMTLKYFTLDMKMKACYSTLKRWMILVHGQTDVSQKLRLPLVTKIYLVLKATIVGLCLWLYSELDPKNFKIKDDQFEKLIQDHRVSLVDFLKP